MASYDQVNQQIRFALETLSERNGQHEFEHICRHFARHRISFNILPATGPVGVGGDQGRDFETFATFITNLGEAKFAAVAESKKLAFACSLQKNVATKARKDVEAIMSGQLRPDIIYFFSSRAIPVATRHQLQEWARKKHSVHLEIIDREALAEQLSDREIFWIATRYLNIAFEIFPSLPIANEEYASKKLVWTKATSPPLRYSEFVEIKCCARYALNDSPPDVGFWLALMEKFEAQRSSDIVWIQAAYEIIVINARLTRCLRGQENRIRLYLGELSSLQYADELENAVAVMSYVVAMYRMGEIGLEQNEIHQRWLELRDKIQTGILKPKSKNQECLWLQIRGHLALVGGVTQETLPNVDEAISFWTRVSYSCANRVDAA